MLSMDLQPEANGETFHYISPYSTYCVLLVYALAGVCDENGVP